MAQHKPIIGIAGVGYWGKNVLRNLKDLGSIELICDTNPDIIAELKNEFPDLRFSVSYKDVVRNPRIQAVVITTPASTHYELTKEALQNGKDVFVEKPLALSVENAQELEALARARNRILMVGHLLHYHPAFTALKKLIEKGGLGKIQYIYSNRLNIGKLRVEENILWSFAPHDISIILALVGEAPLRVSCFGADYVNENICDVTLTNLEFSNGIKAHIFVSWLHPFKEQKLVVIGSKAMAVFDDLTKEKLFIYPHKIEWQKGKIPVAHKAEHYSVKVRDGEPLREEMKHFIDCIVKRKTPKTDAREGLAVLRVLSEAEKSLSLVNSAGLPPLEEKYFIHPTSCVDENVQIGYGTKIWHFSHILKNTKIGNNCTIGQNVAIGPDACIGNRCKIQNNVSVYKGVALEDEVFCGPSCVFTNVYNPRAFIERKDEYIKTTVKKGATIGANATIICGVTIGKYSFVGAGAVVKKDVPDYGLVVGVPARQIGWLCKCAITLTLEKNHARCAHCGNKYLLDRKTNKLNIIKEK